MSKAPTKAEADVAKALMSGESQKVGAATDVKLAALGSVDERKVEARLAALEAYVKANVKAMGWPEFKQ